MANDSDRLTEAIDWMVGRVDRVDDLTAPTPCDEFDVAALLDHLATSMTRFTQALGGTASEPPAGERPGDRFRRLGGDLTAAWQAADPAAEYELPIGHLPAPGLAGIAVSEIVVHGWDVSRATGERADVPTDLAEHVESVGRGLLTDERRGRAFGPAVPGGETPSDRMAGFFGRHP